MHLSYRNSVFLVFVSMCLAAEPGCRLQEFPHLACLRVYADGMTHRPRSIANQAFLSSLVWQLRAELSRLRMSSSRP